ncbi:hypothetical protein B0H67DRAFT_657164 [Lasiosphaeris hirsuta]|uniref:Uncharacterized protein n=1 Tax=Lasiosphaeris hirsuta TaxID=260670 RepID=A0AA40E5E2_9PEZI|nr:hypothetical protein B0H67DRAFT_657164 [Lasiosphaeris hirsuta]
MEHDGNDEEDGQVCNSNNAQDGVIEELEGRGENNGKDNQSNRLLDLVRDIEGITSMDRILSQRWKNYNRGEIDPLLTRVFRMLEDHLPSTYQPEKHWTSPLRTRAGLEPCENLPVDASTFTIMDGSGDLSGLLRQLGCANTKKWASCCTFHIHVVTTASDLLETDFLMGSSPMRKAESLWLDARSGDTWQISLFVDPWDLRTQGKLRLGNLAHYMAQFERDTPHISVRDLLPVLPAQSAAPAGHPVTERPLKRLQKLRNKIFKRSAAPYDGPEEDVRYRYKPLAYRNFRLLELSPSKDPSPLRGTLEGAEPGVVPPRLGRAGGRAGAGLGAVLRRLEREMGVYLEGRQACMALPRPLSAAEREHVLEMPAYTLGLVRERFHGSVAVQRPCLYNLLTLLHVFAHTQASRSVDKLFGLLSLASDAGDAAFDPDYDSPMERVAKRYAAAFVKHGHAAELLCRTSGLRSPGLPSWVLDWTSTTRPETISTWYGARGPFAASKRPHLDASVDGGGNLRVMKATRLAAIDSVGSTTFETSNLLAFLASIHAGMEALLLLTSGTARRRPRNERLSFLDLTDNATATTAAVDKTPSALLDLSAIPDITCIQDVPAFLKQPSPARQNVWNYWQTATSFSRRLGNARFFAAAAAAAAPAPAPAGAGAGAAAMRVGLGPGETEVGDELWIVHGMATPVVLRPRPLRIMPEEVKRVRNVLRDGCPCLEKGS